MSRRVIVPTTSNYTVVFPLKTWSKKYDTSSYNPIQTGDRATLEELSQVLKELETNQRPFKTKFALAFTFYIIGLIACMVLSRIGIYNSYGGYWDEEYGYYEWIPTTNTRLLVLSIAGGIVGIFAMFCLYVAIAVKIVRASRVPAQALFDRVNPSFAGRGLRWQLPNHFPRWVELSKDYVNQTQPVGQPVYMPPPMTQQYQNYPDIPGGVNQPVFNQPDQPIYSQQYQPAYNQPAYNQQQYQPNYNEQNQQNYANHATNQV